MKLFRKINYKALAILCAIIGAVNFDKDQQYPIAYSLGYGMGAAVMFTIPVLIVAKGEKDYVSS